MKAYYDLHTIKDGMVRIHDGKPLENKPKSYKRYDVIAAGTTCNIFTLLKASDGSLRYEKYYDGCLFPFYGRFEYLDK